MIVEPTDTAEADVLYHFKREENNSFSTCALSLIDKDGKVQFHKSGMMCHIFLAELQTQRTAKGIYFSLWYYPGRGHATSSVNRYYDFILDKKVSPWRPVLEHSHVVRDARGNYKAVYITNIENMSTQYLTSFAVATRQPGEDAHRLRTFDTLTQENKLSPIQALYIVSHLSIVNYIPGIGTYTPKSNPKWMIGSNHHFPFNPIGPNSFARLRDANPVLKSNLIFKNDRGFSPLNDIWFDDDDCYIYKKMTTPTVPYTGAFPNFHTSYGRVTNKNITPVFIEDFSWLNKEIESGKIQQELK